jgi:alpha-beta hydrolase superfamily lysophospholipase
MRALLYGTLVAAYALPYGLIAVWQEALIFPAPQIPRSELDRAAATLGATSVALHTPAGDALAWHRTNGDHAHGLYLYFHGNGGTVAAQVDLADAVLARGFETLNVSYPGYPGGTGSASEAGVQGAARAAWTYATTELGFPPAQIVVHGQSLGGGAAALLVAEATPGALILESTFDSVTNVARSRFPIYPISWAIRHPFNSRDHVAGYRGPALLVHAKDDQVVTYERGVALSQALPQATFITVPAGGHNRIWVLDDPATRAAWEALLDGIAAGRAP